MQGLFLEPHLRGFGKRHIVTLPSVLHLFLRIPSGETPASAEGKRVPSKRNNTNNFFMSFESKIQ